jgi:hypothetical protein
MFEVSEVSSQEEMSFSIRVISEMAASMFANAVAESFATTVISNRVPIKSCTRFSMTCEKQEEEIIQRKRDAKNVLKMD